MAVSELIELLDNCGRGDDLKDASQRVLTEVFDTLVTFMPPEEAQDLLEQVFFAACAECGV